MKTFVQHFVTSALVVGTAISGAPAMAQSGESTATLEEIIVMGRRQQEDILDAPFAVTAFTEQGIEDAGIQRMEDVIALTPNVTLATSQGIGTSFLTIRGITQVRNGEAPVAVVVDGVTQFSGVQFRQELFDIQSMEVVKGPQGALYGRNATGGAIIINTKRPTNETEGYFKLGAGNGSEYSAAGTIRGALSEDVLFGQLSANYINRDGYLQNITRNEKADRFEDLTLRSRLIWEPSEATEIDLRASVQQHKGRGIGFQYQAVDIADDGITATGFGVDTGPIDANNVLPVRDNNLDYGERDMTDLSLKFTYETDAGTFVATTGITDIEEWSDSDQFPYTAAIDSDPAAAGLFGFDGTQTGFFDLSALSQEIRFSSPRDRPVRWEVGAYYLDWERFVSLTTGLDTGAGIIRIERAPTTDAANPTESFIADDNQNDATAVFGQINIDLTDNVELSVAGRYDKETREQTVSDLQTPGIGTPGAVNSEEYDMFQPKITLRYQPDDSSNLFFTYGEGFRSGQFNQNGVADAAAGVGLIGVTDQVDQEETSSIEIGYKGQFADDRLRVGASVFTTDVDNQQFFSFIGAISAQILTSIDNVELKGAELDFVYSVSDSWDVYGAYGYIDSEIKAYAVDETVIGNDSPYIAENTLNLGAQFQAPSGFLDADFFARIDLERRGEQYWDVANSTARDALDFVNIRLGLRSQDDQWSITAYADNATDEEYNSEWVAGGFSAAAPGAIYGAEYRYNF